MLVGNVQQLVAELQPPLELPPPEEQLAMRASAESEKMKVDVLRMTEENAGIIFFIVNHPVLRQRAVDRARTQLLGVAACDHRA